MLRIAETNKIINKLRTYKLPDDVQAIIEKEINRLEYHLDVENNLRKEVEDKLLEVK